MDVYENCSVFSGGRFLLPRVEEMFGCGTVATKIPPCAGIRRETLWGMGFVSVPHEVVGHDGRRYGDYYICTL